MRLFRDNRYIAEQRRYERLKRMAKKYNVTIMTATQIPRPNSNSVPTVRKLHSGSNVVIVDHTSLIKS